MVVTDIRLTAFRGSTGEFSASFADDREGRARSVILHGENGSGKSTIVDALEFALRGRLSRRSLKGEKHKREVRNLHTDEAPGVLVTLSDGTQINRGGGLLRFGIPDSFSEPTSGFEYCPIVIRRHDVESFWTIPADSRQEFFFDYLAPDARAREAARESQRIAIDQKLQKAVTRFSRAIGPDFDLPTRHVDTRGFLNRHILPKYGTVNSNTGKKQAPQHIYNAFVEHQNALRKAEEFDLETKRSTPEPKVSLHEVLSAVSLRVADDFREVARKDWIRQIEISLDGSSRLDILVILSNGRRADPTQVLNEAALDLLALLILVDVHVECARLGQRKLIVLDDVFQSVDSVHRIRTLSHVLERLRSWQVVMTLHDRLWLELATSAMRRYGNSDVRVLEVRTTPHDQVPDVRLSGSSPKQALDELIAAGTTPEIVAGVAGRTLEQLCDKLSVALATSVSRRRGDRYTLGDLWPGVSSALRKSGAENLTEPLRDIGLFIDLRNMVGAHYNEWATAVTPAEADDFARSVSSLWAATHCSTCGVTISVYKPAQGSRSFIQLPCRCADI